MDIFSTAFVANLHQELLIRKDKNSNSLIKAFNQCSQNALTIKQQLKKQKLNNQCLKNEIILIKKEHSLVLERLIQTQTQVQYLTHHNRNIQLNMERKYQNQIKTLNQQIKTLIKTQNIQKDKICSLLNNNISLICQVTHLFNQYHFQNKTQILNKIIDIFYQKCTFHNQMQKQNFNSKILNQSINTHNSKNSALKQHKQKGKRKSVTEKSILKKVQLQQSDNRSINNSNGSIPNQESRLTLLINGQIFQQTNIQSQQIQGTQNLDHNQFFIVQQQPFKSQLRRKNKKHFSLKISALNNYIKNQNSEKIQQFEGQAEKKEYCTSNQPEMLCQLKNLQNYPSKKSNKRSSKQSCYLSICDNMSQEKQKHFLRPQPLISKTPKQVQGRIRWEYKKFIQKRQQSLKTIYFTKSIHDNLKDQIKQNSSSQKQNSQVSHISFYEPSYNCL